MRNNKYFKWGLTAFCVIGASIVFWLLIFEYGRLLGIFSSLVGILRPVIVGLVFAYILNPLMTLYSRIFKRIKKENVVRILSVIMAVITGLGILYLIMNLVVPQVVDSVVTIVKNMPAQLAKVSDFLNQKISGDSMTAVALRNTIEYIEGYLPTFAQEKIMPMVNDMANVIVLSATGVINVVMDAVIGLIIAIYLLLGKEKFQRQVKFVLKTFMSEKHYSVTMEIAAKANEVFYGFITGMILDSTIVGIICCIVMIILGIDYAVLVSVIVGCTNVIPMFGPFIGAIPCALIILMQSPLKMLYFIIFIIVMQQIDGNIINPRILGSSTGLSAVWVIFAILLFSGLFGFVGMLIGVPTMSVIYYLMDKWIHNKAKARARKNLQSEGYITELGDEE